jgi:hypothetical protein
MATAVALSLSRLLFATRWPHGAFPTSWFHQFSVARFCKSDHFGSILYGWVLLFMVGLSLPWLFVALNLRVVWDPSWIYLDVLKILIDWFVGVCGMIDQ